MGSGQMIKAHQHELIAGRVEAAIDKATDDIVAMFADRDSTDMDGLRSDVRDIIIRHAYYGDKITSGDITPADLESIREFAAA